MGGDHDHFHFPDHHAEAVEVEDGPDLAWELDNVELQTVGVDIGSSTTHLLFSRLHLQRLSQSLSSRFVVVEREVLHRSRILLTPFQDGTLDAEQLEAFVRRAYGEAGVRPEAVDTGAVILTGVALERRNARAVAELFTRLCGGFVCASAGHNLEAILAAHGSGAVRLSRERPGLTMLHLDVGGGTTKLAVLRDGRVLETAAVAAGGRLLVIDAEGRLERIEPAGAEHARRAGVALALGERLPADAARRLAAEMTAVVARVVAGAADEMVLTAPLARSPAADLVSFSGGVAEYVYGREERRFGDLAPELGEALRAAAAAGDFGAEVVAPPEGIRATVIGASQFTVQVSGNTVHLSDASLLPLRNLPVVDARLEGDRALDSAAIAEAIARGLRRLDLAEGEAPVAVSLRWSGDPRYASLRAVALGLATGLPRSLSGGVPVVLALDADVGRSLGSLLVEELAPQARIASLDGIDVQELDFLDVGDILQPAGVVPVIVKSLAFGS